MGIFLCAVYLSYVVCQAVGLYLTICPFNALELVPARRVAFQTVKGTYSMTHASLSTQMLEELMSNTATKPEQKEEIKKDDKAQVNTEKERQPEQKEEKKSGGCCGGH